MQAAPAPIKAILYDLDGTLVDNFTAIHRAIAHAQAQLGLDPSPYEKVRATVGGSIEVTMARLIGEKLAPKAIPHYHEMFPKVMYDDLKAYAGASWLLEHLHARGMRQAIVTNKLGGPAREVVRHFGWDKWLEHVQGTHDTLWRKPAREFTMHAVEKLGVKPQEALFVGDSPFDIDAAANAGLRSHIVATGSHSRAELLAHNPPPDAVFADLYELGAETFGLTR